MLVGSSSSSSSNGVSGAAAAAAGGSGKSSTGHKNGNGHKNGSGSSSSSLDHYYRVTEVVNGDDTGILGRGPKALARWAKVKAKWGL